MQFKGNIFKKPSAKTIFQHFKVTLI